MNSALTSDDKDYLEVLGFSPFPWGEVDDVWTKFENEVATCRACSLCESRKNVVFGRGKKQARVMFVGEAPTEIDDHEGKAFLGEPGDLLTRMIGAMGLTCEEVFISYVVKCRPPQNRYPEAVEIEKCFPFLKKQIELINPEIVVSLGNFAAQALLRTEESLSHLRGNFQTHENLKRVEGTLILVMPTFHPAHLLREPSLKKAVWEDLQLVMKALAQGARGE